MTSITISKDIQQGKNLAVFPCNPKFVVKIKFRFACRALDIPGMSHEILNSSIMEILR